MVFGQQEKITALAIVSVFETSKAFGDFSAVAVLNDGAGISYGFCQFTHRSGALAAVLEQYLESGGQVARAAIENALPIARRTSQSAIVKLADDGKFRNALRAAGVTREMKAAQLETALFGYLQPAVDECERLKFTRPLSLAVVYDSIVHGSWERFRDAVLRSSPPHERGIFSYEQWFILNYITKRDAWLASVPRLAMTRYRTQFFIGQIKRGNWDLSLPVRVHGVAITDQMIGELSQKFTSDETVSAAGPQLTPQPQTTEQATNSSSEPHDPLLKAQPPDRSDETCLDKVEDAFNAAAAKYDQAGRIATTVTSRTDAAKSLWTTVLGSLTQAFWALLGMFTSMPREVWLVVAIIAAALMLMYLYRQIALGKIRERSQMPGSKSQA